jgi:hypothetical protein
LELWGETYGLQFATGNSLLNHEDVTALPRTEELNYGITSDNYKGAVFGKKLLSVHQYFT